MPLRPADKNVYKMQQNSIITNSDHPYQSHPVTTHNRFSTLSLHSESPTVNKIIAENENDCTSSELQRNKYPNQRSQKVNTQQNSIITNRDHSNQSHPVSTHNRFSPLLCHNELQIGSKISKENDNDPTISEHQNNRKSNQQSRKVTMKSKTDNHKTKKSPLALNNINQSKYHANQPIKHLNADDNKCGPKATINVNISKFEIQILFYCMVPNL